MYRIRARFIKIDLMKFISHLDLMRMMERTLRRSNIPLAYTQGFNPHPRISFATALAIGLSSEDEYIDIDITDKIELNHFKTIVNDNLPAGIKILTCKYISLQSKALMAVVDYSTYIIKCPLKNVIEESEIQSKISAYLDIDELLIEKVSKKDKLKQVDIRPWIYSIEFIQKIDNELILKTTVATGSNGNLKPEILMNSLITQTQLPIDTDKVRIHRLDLFISQNGSLITPMDIEN